MKELLKKLLPPELRQSLRRWQARVINFGTRFYCPTCRSRLRRFHPMVLDYDVPDNITGMSNRPDAFCPVCNSLDRERHVYLHLFESAHSPINVSDRVIHFAPELMLSRALSHHLSDYHTADLNLTTVSLNADLTTLPFSDASVDGIICNHVLEHIPDDLSAMKEIFRVLRPSGWAVLQVPADLEAPSTYEDFSITTPEGRQAAFGQDDHVRVYGQDYVGRLESCGFDVAVYHWQDRSPDWQRCGLIPGEPLFQVRKV